MEYIIEDDKINEHNLIFKMPIKNQNENYIHFYKILFSNKNITLKYILMKLNFTSFTIKQDSHRYKVIINKNDGFIKNIENIEKKILGSINNTINKNIVHNLTNDINSKPYLYSFLHNPNLDRFYIKISGIWESDSSIGLVYKFYYNTSTENLSNMIC
jgi:flavodoxin